MSNCCDENQIGITNLKLRLIGSQLHLDVNDKHTFADLTPIIVPFKQGQSIVFTPIPAVTEQTTSITLTAFSTSGLPITYYSSNPSVASISGNVVTIHTSGTVYITATQDGNNEYNAATPVMEILYVVPEGAVFNVLYGWRDTGTVPTEQEISTYFESDDIISGEEEYTITFPTLNDQKYYLILEPITQPIKTKWFANSLRNGNISGFPETIRLDSVTVGPYRVYITNYKTNFEDPIQLSVQ